MGYGGATEGTAGTLEIGDGNTFDPAAVTEHGRVIVNGLPQVPYHHAWWAYTHAGEPGRVTLDVTGTTWIGPPVNSWDHDLWAWVFLDGDPITSGGITFGSPDGSLVFDVEAGQVFTIVMGTQFEDDSLEQVDTYRMSASLATYRYSPWFALEDDPELNVIIIAPFNPIEPDNPVILDDNPNPTYSSEDMPDWVSDAIRAGRSRRGSYSAQEVLGGDPVYGALGCVIAHAYVGHEGNQSWNTSGSGTAPTEPVCQEVPTGGDAEVHSPTSITTVRIATETTEDGLPHVADTTSATMGGPAWSIWHLAVRDNLDWWGVLTGDALAALDPESHGLPSDAELVPETGFPELLGIDLADADPVPSSVTFSNLWVLDDPIAPVWADGLTGPWHIGPPGIPPMILPPHYTRFGYSADDALDDPDVDRWTPIPETEGWDGHGWVENWTYDPDEAPASSDGMLIAWPADYPDLIPENSVYDETRPARPGLRYRLAAPRFRFRWLPAETPTVVRQYPRDDARGTSSAPRLWPPSKSRRLAGGYPGGSGA